MSSVSISAMSRRGSTAPGPCATCSSSKQRTRWSRASTSRTWPRKRLPSPSPLLAPSTRPAISTTSSTLGTTLREPASRATSAERFVRHRRAPHVGLDRAERVVADLGRAARYQRVEERGLAHVGQAHDAAPEAHSRRSCGCAPLRPARCPPRSRRRREEGDPAHEGAGVARHDQRERVHDGVERGRQPRPVRRRRSWRARGPSSGRGRRGGRCRSAPARNRRRCASGCSAARCGRQRRRPSWRAPCRQARSTSSCRTMTASGAELVEAHGGAHGAARFVHVGLRLEREHRVVAHAAFGDLAVKARAPPECAEALRRRQRVERHEARRCAGAGPRRRRDCRGRPAGGRGRPPCRSAGPAEATEEGRARTPRLRRPAQPRLPRPLPRRLPPAPRPLRLPPRRPARR